ncbi:hypothetical protein AMS59_04330 [Lysinibacillus sp. FJAT-14745]|uniref:DUF378 domain-containing protein n=1 Tax=Lysinibacillus sp. FJAT-14745 TaxID=1704289 RepID=UPI0006AB7E7D|nr:DUF378 domain-containing protein [Lysinibacillus sp. FJAT-14745]KOP80609.1 hypothetical protein AMS59_04330 [Lysinibacillus sp. FJAT-14745]
MSVIYRIALVLVIIGAINWGLIGFFRFDLVAYLFGGQTAVLSRWIYAFIGLAGLISLPILVMRFDEDEDLVPDSDLNLDHDHRTRIDRNPSYGMEFGDEADFTALKTTNVLKEEKKDSHSKNKTKNKNKNKK